MLPHAPHRSPSRWRWSMMIPEANEIRIVSTCGVGFDIGCWCSPCRLSRPYNNVKQHELLGRCSWYSATWGTPICCTSILGRNEDYGLGIIGSCERRSACRRSTQRSLRNEYLGSRSRSNLKCLCWPSSRSKQPETGWSISTSFARQVIMREYSHRVSLHKCSLFSYLNSFRHKESCTPKSQHHYLQWSWTSSLVSFLYWAFQSPTFVAMVLLLVPLLQA